MRSSLRYRPPDDLIVWLYCPARHYVRRTGVPTARQCSLYRPPGECYGKRKSWQDAAFQAYVGCIIVSEGVAPVTQMQPSRLILVVSLCPRALPPVTQMQPSRLMAVSFSAITFTKPTALLCEDKSSAVAIKDTQSLMSQAKILNLRPT